MLPDWSASHPGACEVPSPKTFAKAILKSICALCFRKHELLDMDARTVSYRGIEQERVQNCGPGAGMVVFVRVGETLARLGPAIKRGSAGGGNQPTAGVFWSIGIWGVHREGDHKVQGRLGRRPMRTVDIYISL